MKEALDRHAAAPEPPVGAREEIAAADAVYERAHRDAALARADQRLDEARADGIGAEDVARQGDAGLGGVDRREHFRIGLVAVAEQLDGVAAFDRPFSDPAAGALEQDQMIVAPG